jgi:WD repeat-containing protein 89
VGKLSWHHQDKLSCITNTNDLLLYDVNEQDLIKKWDRAAVCESIKRKSVIDCHIVDCYNYGSDEMMFLATSNYNKGECLRTMKFNKDSLDPVGNFTGNSQIIRASLYNKKDNCFFTFGEGAIITLWKEGTADDVTSSKRSADFKEDSSIKKKLKKKSNPY